MCVCVCFWVCIDIHALTYTYMYMYMYVPLPKKGDLAECSNYRTIALISQCSKVLLKIIQKRLEPLKESYQTNKHGSGEIEGAETKLQT